MSSRSFFPPIITDLPEAELPFEGIQAYLVQGDNQQVIFMAFDRDTEVPEHSHEAQWAVVLDGEIEITIAGEIRICHKGDTYYIPRGIRHRARIKAGYKDVTLFNQKDRYQRKVDDL